MAPLRRRTLAMRGHTPTLKVKASHREKVSVAAALWKTPRQDRIRLYYRSYPDSHIGSGCYAQFLEELLEDRLRREPVVILHDGGPIHQGKALELLLEESPRLLGSFLLPPYAPMLNPVEGVWDWLKYDELPNYAPTSVPQLDAMIQDRLFRLHHDQPRLRTFVKATPLRW